LTWHQACSDNPRVRQPLPLILLVLASCCLSVAQEDATTGSASSGSSGGITGCGTTSGTSVPLPPGPCGPGTSWVGDTCVVSCAAPVTSSIDGADSICLLPDGGFGNCAAGACLARGDPSNCGGLGLVCPAPWSCIGGFYGSYCGIEGNPGNAFSCGAGTCPEAAPQCVPRGGCVASCGPCSDNQACFLGDAGLGFCCAGDCQASGSDNRVGCGLGCPEGTFYAGYACVPFEACGPRNSAGCLFPDGGLGACCGGRCGDPAAQCDPVSSCGGAIDGTLCAFVEGVDGECCGSQCSLLQDDSANCGGCGVACGPDAFCAGGYCKPLLDCGKGGGWLDEYGDCLTDAGTVGWCCGPICVDLTKDPQNCGSCGSACPVGGICFSGIGEQTRCVNDAGQKLLCDGGAQCPAGTSCLELGCLSPDCDGTRAFCSFDGGTGFCCGTQCTTGGLGCGGACPADTAPTDGSDGCSDGGPPCGSGAMCPVGTFCQRDDEECVPFDSCLPSLQNPGFNDCFPGPSIMGECCGDACVDVLQDPNNCGGCGVVCSSGICIYLFGGVSASWPLCLPAGPTNDCLLSCPADSVCLEGQCINGVSPGIGLPFCLAEDGTIGAFCAPGVCANPRDDPQNCGSCGNVCGPGQSCVAGSCTGRPGCGNGREGFFCNLDAGTSYACCPSVGCTDTDTDPNNCGSCRQQCPPGSSCVSGTCT